MKEFIDAMGYLAIGFAVGYLWNTLWTIGKKVWTEAKKAREEW